MTEIVDEMGVSFWLTVFDRRTVNGGWAHGDLAASDEGDGWLELYADNGDEWPFAEFHFSDAEMPVIRRLFRATLNRTPDAGAPIPDPVGLAEANAVANMLVRSVLGHGLDAKVRTDGATAVAESDAWSLRVSAGENERTASGGDSRGRPLCVYTQADTHMRRVS